MKTLSNINNNQGIVLIIALIFLFITTLLGISAMRASLLNEKMAQSNIQREQAFEAAEAALLAGERLVDENAAAVISSIVIPGSPSVPATLTTAAQVCQATAGGNLTVNGNSVTITGGICAPVEVTVDNSGNPTGRYNNWRDIDGDPLSLEVWDTTNRHIVIDDAIKNAYGLLSSPKYIVEFMGYVGTDGSNGETACTSPGDLFQLDNWPYCNLDPAQFRITAFATSGNLDETRVMLQSTYVVN